MQAGYFGYTDPTDFRTRACAWAGTADSCVNLHDFLPAEYQIGDSHAKDVTVFNGVVYVSGLIAMPGGQSLAVVWTLPDDGICKADFNGDGFVTGDDFDAYVIEFIAGNSDADFNHDGFVTGDDFDAFVVAFEAGC